MARVQRQHQLKQGPHHDRAYSEGNCVSYAEPAAIDERVGCPARHKHPSSQVVPSGSGEN